MNKGYTQLNCNPDHTNPLESNHHSQSLDAYRFRNTVPKNLPRLTLDYNSEHTCEGELKAAVLMDSTSNIVEVIAEGMGGAGKTCALIGLASEPDVRHRFKDGLFFVSLGNCATKPILTQAIISIVRRTGGRNLAKELSALETVEEVVEDAAEWFSSRACLFLVDDVWGVNGINSCVLLTLTKLVDTESRLVYTTRDKEISIECQKSIHFGIKDRNLSRSIFMRHAYDGDVNLNDENEAALQHILEVCSGHPLSLAVAGGSVRRIAACMDPRWRQNALKRVAAQMLANESGSQYRNSLVDKCQPSAINESSVTNIDSFVHPYYGQTTQVVDASLQVLQEGHKSCYGLFKRLSILQKQQKPPIGMLHKLWGMRSMRETWKAARLFYNVSLIQLHFDEDGDYFQVHDLILDISRDKAGTQIGKFVPGLLNRYMIWRAYHHRQWWECCDDGYLHDNLCRLLAAGPYKKELRWLLQRPQWIIMRLQRGGLDAVERDIEQALPVLRRGGEHVGSQWKHSKIINQAVRMSHLFVLNNSREAWFQIHGRLLLFTHRCIWTRRFVEEMESCAPRPWAKSSVGFLDAAGGMVQHIIPYKECVAKVAINDKKVMYITHNDFVSYDVVTGEQKLVSVGGNLRNEGSKILERVILLLEGSSSFTDRKCFIPRSGFIAFESASKLVARRSGRALEIWDMKSGELAGPPLEVCKGSVTGVVFSNDAKRIVSAYDDGSARLWDVESGKLICTPFKGHEDDVKCMTIIGNGKRIVSGSLDGTMRLWDVKNGQLTGGTLIGRTTDLRSVGCSGDEEHIVSESYDGTLRVWDVKSGKLIYEPHTLEVCTDDLRCWAISSNGKRVVLGLQDGSVELWDLDRGKQFRKCVGQHDGSVMSVEFGDKDMLIVSRSTDRTIRVWDARSKGIVRENVTKYPYVDRYMALSGDRTRVVSRSRRGNVKIWDAVSGELIGSLVEEKWENGGFALSPDGKQIAAQRHFGRVFRVGNLESGEMIDVPLVKKGVRVSSAAFSSDGLLIALGSYNGAVRVYDLRSRALISAHLEMHREVVKLLAFSGDRKRVISVSYRGTVQVCDLQNEEPVGEPLPRCPLSEPPRVAGYERERRMSVSSDETIPELGTRSFNGEWTTCVKLSDDGTRLVSGSKTGLVQFKDIHDGKGAEKVFVHGDEIIGVAMNSDGTFVASKDFSGMEKLWDVQSGQCICTLGDIQWKSETRKICLTWSFATMKSRRILSLDWVTSGESRRLATFTSAPYKYGEYHINESSTAICRVQM